MYSNDLQKLLIDNFVTQSAAERTGHGDEIISSDHRRHIGLSHVGQCELVNYREVSAVSSGPHSEYQRISAPSVNGKLKFALANALEYLLVERLQQLNLYRPGRELIAFDGLVRGHTDGEICKAGELELLEIKTLEQSAWIPKPPRLPHNIFYQVQAYMHYGKYARAHVVYLARNDGLIRVVGGG